MNIRTSPREILREYESCVRFNDSIGLYDTVRRNERFYIGEQWDGLDAPDLDKPVLNFLKRVGSYVTAMLVSDDIACELTPFAGGGPERRAADLLTRRVGEVFEATRAKSLLRELVRACVVDGDGCFYWYFDNDAPGPGEVRGDVALERLENTDVLFGNPFLCDVQKQPYLLLVRREPVDAVRERAARFRTRVGDIRPDREGLFDGEDGYDGGDLCTVLLKLFRRKGKVHFVEVTRDAVVRPETDTGCTLYPVCWMNWERVRSRYHGQALLTGLIPNQIAVNKLWAMAIRHEHMLAFPKVFYDRMKLRGWTNRPGEAIGVAGDPGTAVAAAFRAPDLSPQLLEIVDRTIRYTKEFMGASDAALGDVRPENTSAILAVQNATAAPLELQKRALYQFTEDCVRVVAELVCAHCGPRRMRWTDEAGAEHAELFDFSALDPAALRLNVEVGASSYWSELKQMTTLDNLFAKGVLSDALLYLESVPDGYIRNKRAMIERLRAGDPVGERKV